MKRDWEPEELAAIFGLAENEQRWLGGRADYHQLGLAVLLKYFQLEGRFPLRRTDIPLTIVRYLAEQLDVPLTRYPRYVWRGRTFERDRQAVRERLGFREISVEEVEALTLWLENQPLLSEDQAIAKLKGLAYSYLRERHLEPSSPDRLDRAVRTALHRFEQRFFQSIWRKLSPAAQAALDSLLLVETLDDEQQAYHRSPMAVLKADPGPLGVKSVLQEIAKLRQLQAIVFPTDIFGTLHPKLIAEYAQRAAAEPPRELRQHPEAVRYTLLTAFCWRRRQEIIDNLVELLIQIVHKMNTRAEHRVERAVLAEVKHVHNKQQHLVKMARASVANPQGTVEEVIFPVVSQTVLHDIISEAEASRTYTQQVHHELRSSYSHHYRALLPPILTALQFESSNILHRPIIRALQLVRKYAQGHQVYYPLEEEIPIQDVVPVSWIDLVVETTTGEARVNRINYEMSVLHTLRQKLRSKEVWVDGADKYRNPDRDLPADFDIRRDEYYKMLRLPIDVEAVIQRLQGQMQDALTTLNDNLPTNPQVRLLKRNNGWIKLSPLEALPEPPTLGYLKTALVQRWGMINLLDMLKETDLRLNFSQHFKSVASREHLDPAVKQRRLLLALYALGTNMGLKQMSLGEHGESYESLLYLRWRKITWIVMGRAKSPLPFATCLASNCYRASNGFTFKSYICLRPKGLPIILISS